MPNLPTDGSTIYVRLSSQINGNWQYKDYTYQTYQAASAAEMISPAPGSTLGSSSVTFSWSSGIGVTQYFLYLGRSTGGNDIYGQSQGTNQSVTLNNLPTDGSTIYVRLYSLINGTWQYRDYAYQTYQTATAAEMISPAPGSALGSSSVTFSWSSGIGVTQYWLTVGRSAGGYDIYGQSQGTNQSVTVNNLPTDGSTIYVRLYSLINGNWLYRDYTY